MTKSQKQNLDNVIRYTLLTVWLLIVLFPLFWIVATSFKPDKDWLAWPPVYWSEEPTMSNYNNVWGCNGACRNAICSIRSETIHSTS